MGQLSDLCIKITKGTTPTTLKKQFTNEGINFIKVESINEVYGFIPEKFAFIDEETNELLKRSKIEENDILFTIAGTLGRIAIADVSILPANTNQAVAIIRCSSTDYINYVLFLLKSDLFLSTITSKAVHAVQANISLGVISDTEIVIPKTEILLEFNNAINPIMKKMVENNYHTQTLTQTRDTLLPKLMSGKIELV
jgi:type I restriction enzyme S subunit